MKRKAKQPNVSDLLTENVIRKLAWRATLRARSIRSDARAVWQDKKKNAVLKYRASQFEDLSTMLKELLNPEELPQVDLKLGSNTTDVPDFGDQNQ